MVAAGKYCSGQKSPMELENGVADITLFYIPCVLVLVI